MSLKTVKRFAENWKKKGLPLHILINNAGIAANKYEETEDGYETIWTTNHLGPFLLTNLLLDNLKQGAPSRVVVVSSGAHLQTDIIWDDISGRNTWYNGTGWIPYFTGPLKAYAQSKTANILFSVKLNEKMSGFGTSNAIHPGEIFTGLFEDGYALYSQTHPLFSEISYTIVPILFSLFGKTPSQGAATQVYVATAPELNGVGGKYFVDCNEEEPGPHACDPKSADRLWKLSEEMVAKYL